MNNLLKIAMISMMCSKWAIGAELYSGQEFSTQSSIVSALSAKYENLADPFCVQKITDLPKFKAAMAVGQRLSSVYIVKNKFSGPSIPENPDYFEITAEFRSNDGVPYERTTVSVKCDLACVR